MLAEAVAIYLAEAYSDGHVPPAVRELARIDPSAPLGAALDAPGVERRDVPGRPGVVGKHRWRLGNARYRHMKLGIERCSDADDFVFVADTHDRDLPLGSSAPEEPGFAEFLLYNSGMKRAIESRWQQAGIPTLSGHLTSYLRERCAAAGPRPRTVLLVEDDDAIRWLEQNLLEEAGYRVVAVAGGLKALEALEDDAAVDCCLLDIMMPTLNGIELARRLRSEGRCRFPIIYVTALPPERARDGVADDYVGKPFDPDHLLAAIRKHTGEGS